MDSVLAQLARLSGFGIGFHYNVLGQLSIGSYTSGLGDWSNLIHIDGSNANGLDYVPFDGYLSELHEGEAVLREEEAKVWRQMTNGNGIDYDTMGGVMRDNIKPGGNVYLDGRIVGDVISAQQGRSYRQLQRSGWQA